uniref:Uncharacterized protein n=1 Tax=Parascaris univalens TaxID=6257 RepID=A0A914ZH44_PARUN
VFRSRPLFDIAETAFFFVISSSGPLDRCVVYRSRTDEVGEKNANTAILRSERGEIESRPTLRFVSQARFQVKSFFATGERFCNRERQNVQLAQHKLLRGYPMMPVPFPPIAIHPPISACASGPVLPRLTANNSCYMVTMRKTQMSKKRS